MEMLLERASAKRATKSQNRREVLDHLDFTEKQLQLVTVEMKDKICKMVEEVEHKVRKHKGNNFPYESVNCFMVSNAIGIQSSK